MSQVSPEYCIIPGFRLYRVCVPLFSSRLKTCVAFGTWFPPPLKPPRDPHFHYFCTYCPLATPFASVFRDKTRRRVRQHLALVHLYLDNGTQKQFNKSLWIFSDVLLFSIPRYSCTNNKIHIASQGQEKKQRRAPVE